MYPHQKKEDAEFINKLRQAREIISEAIDLRVDRLLKIVRSGVPSENEVAALKDEIATLSSVLAKVERYLDRFLLCDWRSDGLRHSPSYDAAMVN